MKRRDVEWRVYERGNSILSPLRKTLCQRVKQITAWYAPKRDGQATRISELVEKGSHRRESSKWNAFDEFAPQVLAPRNRYCHSHFAFLDPLFQFSPNCTRDSSGAEVAFSQCKRSHARRNPYGHS